MELPSPPKLTRTVDYLEILDQRKVKDVYRTFTVNVLSLECSFVLAFVNFRFNDALITTFFLLTCMDRQEKQNQGMYSDNVDLQFGGN